jgi:hypothetical protein
VTVTILAAPPVTQWPERLGLTLGVLAIFALGAFGMWRSWRRRVRAQAGLLPLPVPPAEAGEPLAVPAPGLYVGTTAAGDWQKRIVAGGLSGRARGVLTPYAGFLAVDRQGAAPIAIPREAVRAVRVDRALAGKVLGPGGMLVVTWDQRGTQLDSGFAADDRGQQDACLTALRAWVPASTTQNGGTPE